jgi:hypothetical protein
VLLVLIIWITNQLGLSLKKVSGMKTLLIKAESNHNANLIAQFAKALKMDVKQLSEKQLDDYHFAKLIDEGMKSKTIQEEEVLNFFHKHGISI